MVLLQCVRVFCVSVNNFSKDLAQVKYFLETFLYSIFYFGDNWSSHMVIFFFQFILFIINGKPINLCIIFVNLWAVFITKKKMFFLIRVLYYTTALYILYHFFIIFPRKFHKCAVHKSTIPFSYLIKKKLKLK